MFSKLCLLGLVSQFSGAQAFWYFFYGYSYYTEYCTDCQGGSGPCWYVGDDYCDDGAYADFNCAEYNFDGGDCPEPAATTYLYPPSGEAGATIRLVQFNSTSYANVGGNRTSGLLEVLTDDGNWSTMCGYYLDIPMQTAATACRDLGFTAGRAVSRSSLSLSYLEAPSNQLLNYTRVCTGDEDSFSDCAAGPLGDGCPSINYDIAVECSHEDIWCEDCDGRISVCDAIGDGNCDDFWYVYDDDGNYYYTNFFCEELNYDGGDCEPPDTIVYYYNPDVENPTIRLAQFNQSAGTFDAGTSIYGVLQVYHDGVWGSVCDSAFGSADQGVACRELGFESGSYIDPYFLGFESGDLPHNPHMDYVACTGNESSLLNCSHSEPGYSCSAYSWYDVGLFCHAVNPNDDYHAYNYDNCRDCNGNPGYCPYVGDGDCDAGSFYYDYNCSEYNFDEGDCQPQEISYYTNPDSHSPTIRIAQHAEDAANNDGNSVTGLLEVLVEGEWGTVCSFKFGSIDQKVACQELGFATGSFVSRYSLGISDSAVAHNLHMNDVTCEGSEESLLDCWHHDTDTCTQYADVGLTCHNNVTEDYYSHHYYAYDWSDYLCPDCHGQATYCSYVGDGYCDDSYSWGHLNCEEFNFDGGDCVAPESQTVQTYYRCLDESTDVRLVSLASNETDVASVAGVVEVRDGDGVWGPICSNPFSDGPEAAQVVCNQLGLAGGEVLWRSETGLKNDDLNNQRSVYDAVECNGTEASVLDCDLTPSIYRCTGPYFMSINCTVDSKSAVDDCADTSATDAPGTNTTEDGAVPPITDSAPALALTLGAVVLSAVAAFDAHL